MGAAAGRARALNQRKQVIGGDIERSRDLSDAMARDHAGLSPADNCGAGNPENIAQRDNAAGLFDQGLNSDAPAVHAGNSRIFRRCLSTSFVGHADTNCRKFRQTGDVDLKAIGRRVQKLRKKAGEVQEDLAAAADVTRPTIAGIESGKDQGGLKTMVAIADHYKVPLDWLLCRQVPPGGPAVGKIIDRPDQIAWVDFWDSLTPAERTAVVTLLRIPLPHEVA